MTSFIVHYTAEQREDPQLGPEGVVATAAGVHGLTLSTVASVIDVTGTGPIDVDFLVTGRADPAELAHLLKRLARHDLRVTVAEGNEVSAS